MVIAAIFYNHVSWTHTSTGDGQFSWNDKEQKRDEHNGKYKKES